MANGIVQVPPDSTGKKLQTFENTIGGNLVEAEAVALVDTTGASILGTAGTPSADVLSVQGVAGGTAIPVSGTFFQATQPVSGTVAATESGAWNVNQTLATPGFEAITDGTTGPAAVKAASTAAVATDKALVVAISPNNTIPVSIPVGQAVELLDSGGTNKASISAAGALKVDGSAVTQPISGTVALSAGSAVVGVTGVVQGSTTAGQTGDLVQGAVTTAAPTYTTAQTSPLSLNTAGGLRVDGSGVTQPVSNASLPLPTGAATSANQPSNAAQGSTTSGQTGTLIEGAVTNTVPTYTTAQTSPLSLSTAGLLRISTFGSQTRAAVSDNISVGLLMTDSTGNTSNPGAPVVLSMGYGGAFSGAADATRSGWSKTRMPTVFKTVQATASGNTAVWTPGSGNKFRLLKTFVQITNNASLAAAAVLTISLQDSSTGMPVAVDVFVPTTAVTTTVGTGVTTTLDLGQFGILSAAANNVLNVNLSATLVTGNVRIVTMGTEE